MNLQKQLFTYISGGAKSPNFLTNKHFIKKKIRKLDIEFIKLNKFYKKKENFTDKKLKFLLNNSEKLKQDYIDFSYVELTPKNLLGVDEFNQAFFDKIDEIENKISKNIEFKTIKMI